MKMTLVHVYMFTHHIPERIIDDLDPDVLQDKPVQSATDVTVAAAASPLFAPSRFQMDSVELDGDSAGRSAVRTTPFDLSL